MASTIAQTLITLPTELDIERVSTLFALWIEGDGQTTVVQCFSLPPTYKDHEDLEGMGITSLPSPLPPVGG